MQLFLSIFMQLNIWTDTEKQKRTIIVVFNSLFRKFKYARRLMMLLNVFKEILFIKLLVTIKKEQNHKSLTQCSTTLLGQTMIFILFLTLPTGFPKNHTHEITPLNCATDVKNRMPKIIIVVNMF